MSKRLVDIDDETLREAQNALGTATIKDTVNAALVETIKAASRRKLDGNALRRFSSAARDLGDPTVMAQAWD